MHATGSGLACPDWPLCLGTFFPEMTGAVLYEHSHRLIAGTTGLLVLTTGLLHFFSFTSSRIQALMVGLIVLIIIQAVLGGMTVLYRLPSWISTLHFLLAHLTFGGMFTVSWCYFAQPTKSLRSEYGFVDRGLLLFALGILTFQMGLGAWLRHIGSKGPPLESVCQNFPWCLPDWIGYMTNYYRSVYWFHRWLAGPVVVVIVGFCLRELIKRGKNTVEFKLSFVASIFVLFQIILGVLSVRASLSILFVMLHTGGALVLFTLLLWINNRIFELGETLRVYEQ